MQTTPKNNTNNGNGRAITRTLRLDQDVDGKLRNLADKDRLSINIVANKALRRYVEWEALADRFHFIAVSSDLLEKMLDYIPADQIRELGKWSILNTARGIAPFREENLASEIATLEYLGSYSRRYTIDQHMTGPNAMIIVLTHHMGRNWSMLYEEVLRSTMEDHMGRDVKNYKIDSTNSQVAVELQFDRNFPESGTNLRPNRPLKP